MSMTPNIMQWGQRPTPNDPANPGKYRYKILAEGDSWFTLGGVPQWNLLRSFDALPFDHVIVTLADPGDRIRDMAKIAKNGNLKKALSERFGYEWNVILLSGGGNDLIDYAKDLLRSGAGGTAAIADFVHQDRLAEVLAYIQLAYRKIAALRDAPASSCAGVSIITHTYDYATPRNAPALIGPIRVSGPWLQPAMDDAGIPTLRWNELSAFLTDRLAEALLDLQHGAAPIPNFSVIDTRGSLQPAERVQGDSNDWQNEIHPNRGGYDKLAALIQPQVLSALA